jgi:hypothetical protein
VLLGLFGTLLSTGPASADESCGGDVRDRLKCWTQEKDDRTFAVTVNRELPFQDLGIAVPDDLEVRVPEGKPTGEGGTALLVLADHRFVHPKARITRLTDAEIRRLVNAGVCTRQPGTLCDLVGPGTGKTVAGSELIGLPDVAPLDRTEYALDDAGSGPGRKDWLLIGMSALLAVLVAALFLAVRRTHRPLAVAGAAPVHRAQEPERTTRLRVAPPRRTAAPRPGPSRPAVVRTDLHPQGYVELDRVLYRAVWAEPGQSPPPPGSRVDVTDAPEPDSDVLYAFAPAAGRHAHAHAR